MSDNAAWKAVKPFATGASAGMFATCCIQPIDMVKVRIQILAGTAEAAGPFTVAANMIKNDGFLSMYAGLSAGLTRQVVYTGARLGLFDIFTEKAKDPETGKVSFGANALCALSAGGIAAFIGNPCDLALIRMQSDNMLPKEQRAGYAHVGSALGGILKQEGPAGLLKGAAPTVTRAMALNLGMLATNATAKEKLKDAGVTGMAQTFGASAIAGFFASAFSLPFDFVKTQMQKQRPDPITGELKYSSSLDCVAKTMAEGGPLRFYAGFPTFYIRIAPHAMITLLAQDAIKGFWARNGL